MATYYKQHQRAKKGQLPLPLPLTVPPEPKRSAHRPHAGIPEFEFRTPNNPHIIQSELFTFTGSRADEPIGFDCLGVNDRQPFLVKLWMAMDRAYDRAKGFNSFRSFPQHMLDYANPNSQ